MSSTRLTHEIRRQIFTNVMSGKFEVAHLQHQKAKKMYSLFSNVFKKERNSILKALKEHGTNLQATRSHTLTLAYPRVKGERSITILAYAEQLISPNKHQELQETQWQEARPILKEAYCELFSSYLEGYAETQGEPNEPAKYDNNLFFYGPSTLKLDNYTPTVAQQKKIDAIFELHIKIQEHEKLRRQLGSQVNAVLEAANTTKQLLDAWPEVDQYLPVIPGISRAITVRIDDLNKLLAKA